MTARGMKQFAVMAMAKGWKKPRYVWCAGTRQLQIFSRRIDAQKCADVMSDPKQPGGKMGFCNQYKDRSHNTPIVVEVDWVVVPVWTETILP